MTPSPHPAEAQEREAKAWKELFWQVALALKCLPSTFIDGNAHVLRAANEAQAARASHAPAAASGEAVDGLTEPKTQTQWDRVYGLIRHWAGRARKAEDALAKANPAATSWPSGLLDRVKAAEQRIQDGHAPRRIPADPTDVDLVLAEVRMLLEGKTAPHWIEANPAAGAEPVGVVRHVPAPFYNGTHAQAFLNPNGEQLPDHALLYAGAPPATSERDVEDGPEVQWRALALQFDGHRMQALGHLRMLLSAPTQHADTVRRFLAAPPLSGEAVLAEFVASRATSERDAEDAARYRWLRDAGALWVAARHDTWCFGETLDAAIDAQRSANK